MGAWEVLGSLGGSWELGRFLGESGGISRRLVFCLDLDLDLDGYGHCHFYCQNMTCVNSMGYRIIFSGAFSCFLSLISCKVIVRNDVRGINDLDTWFSGIMVVLIVAWVGGTLLLGLELIGLDWIGVHWI